MGFKLKMRHWIIALSLILFFGCDKGDSKKDNPSENNPPKVAAKKLEDSTDKEDDNHTKNPIKGKLKKHLEELNLQLQQKSLNNLQFNQGTKEHIRHFESLYNRQDLPKQKDSTQQNPNEILEKAYEIQNQQLKKLQQKNDEIW